MLQIAKWVFALFQPFFLNMGVCNIQISAFTVVLGRCPVRGKRAQGSNWYPIAELSIGPRNSRIPVRRPTGVQAGRLPACPAAAMF